MWRKIEKLINEDSIEISTTYTSKKIDWSKYSKLYIKLGASDLRYAKVYFMISQNVTIPDWWTPSNDSNLVSFYKEYVAPIWSAGTVLEFDISQVTNTGIFMIATMDNVGDLYISDIWIE